MPFVLMGAGVVLVVVGYVWAQDEVDNPDRRWWLVYDLITSGERFALIEVGMMGVGCVLIFMGWRSLR